MGPFAGVAISCVLFAQSCWKGQSVFDVLSSPKLFCKSFFAPLIDRLVREDAAGPTAKLWAACVSPCHGVSARQHRVQSAPQSSGISVGSVRALPGASPGAFITRAACKLPGSLALRPPAGWARQQASGGRARLLAPAACLGLCRAAASDHGAPLRVTGRPPTAQRVARTPFGNQSTRMRP